MLPVIDDAWQRVMQKPAADAIGCMTDYDYASVFEQYVSDATDALLQHLQEPDVRNQMDASFHPLMDSIPAKFKLVSLNLADLTYGLPVLTRSPLAALALHFDQIPLVLKEVCIHLSESCATQLMNQQTARWFNPLVDYLVAFSKSSNSVSYSQAALDALKQYDCLMKGCPAGALVSLDHQLMT